MSIATSPKLTVRINRDADRPMMGETVAVGHSPPDREARCYRGNGEIVAARFLRALGWRHADGRA